MVFLKRKRLLICGFYGHHNLGDEAMLAGMLRLFQRCLGPNYLDQITVYSNDPEDTTQRHGVATLRNQFPRRRREQWIRWAEHTWALWQHQLFILGGGDLLRDSPTREVAITWLQPLQRAMALGCRTIVLGISVGEVWQPQTKIAIVETLNRVNLIAVRDQRSQAQLKQMGVTRPVYVISDLALQLTTPRGSQTVSVPQVSAPKIAISIRSLTGRLPEMDQAVEHRFYREMAQIIDYLVEAKGAAVSLFPFQTQKPNGRGQDNDEDAIAAVLQQSQQRQHITVHGAFSSVEQTLDVLQSFDLMIGTRLHSLILAAGLGIPVLAAVYDPKVSGFMTEIEQQVNSFSIQQFTLDIVQPRLDALLSQPPQSQYQLIQAVEHYRQQITPVERKLCQLFNS